ncbi:MAG: helix-turn-helix domain-containing protein [bacterium]
MLNPGDIGRRIRELRQDRELSLRALAQKSGVAVSFLSKVEAGRGSPTLVTLLKILEALNCTAPEFFAAPDNRMGDVLVQRQADMKILDDGDKLWRYLFPNVAGVKAVMTYEEYRPRTRHVETEQHTADICGVVLAGTLTLELPGEDAVTVNAGDSFYIRAGTPHAAANRGGKLLRLVVAELSHTGARPLTRGRAGK